MTSTWKRGEGGTQLLAIIFPLTRKVRMPCKVPRRRRRTVVVLCVTVLLMTFLAQQMTRDKTTSAKRRNTHPASKLILVYTPVPGQPWAPLKSEADHYEFRDWDGTPCEESRCKITYDRRLLNVSHAVLINAYAHPLPGVEEMTRNRPAHQRWIFYVKESPATLGGTPTRFDGMFNWTATYRRDSDFFVPYGAYAKVKPTTSERDAVNFALNRDKMVAFGMSTHCGGKRPAFVRALMKHIQVNVYGRCASRIDPAQTWHCPHNLGEGCAEELARHKFYLALENSHCIDYLTEKYWRNSLERGLLPVVLGGSGYGPELAIPGSFINAADFESVTALADYLKYLDRNDTAYNEYFQWKSKYKVIKYPFWLCQLCEALHDPTKPAKTYTKLSEFWGVEENCEIGVQHVWDMISRG